MPIVKSAIREVRDQLFLDRADGEFLSVVTENIGMDRPLFGFASDEVWRAVVRRLALDYKQVLPVFHDLLTAIFGPQFTSVSVLLEDTVIGDETLYLADEGLALPQRGTLILDVGLATEETVEYSFRDPRTGEVELDTALTQTHTALVTSGANNLASDAAAGDFTITLEDSLEFPDPASVGDYPIIIDAGKTGTRSDTSGAFAVAGSVVTFTASNPYFTADLVGKFIRIAGATTVGNDGLFKIDSYIDPSNITWTNASAAAEAFAGKWTVLGLDVEEIVIVTSKVGNVLTLTTALVYDHTGPTTSPMTTPLTAVTVNDTMIFGTDVNEFPAEGLLQVQEDTGSPSEFVRFEDKDNTDLSFALKTPLAGSYATAMITLAVEGAAVQLAQAQVVGIDWDVVETEPNLLRIILPEILDRNRLRDASFLHDSGGTPSTAVAAGGDAAAEDEVLEVTDASSFPAAGVIRIDAAGTPEDVSYYRVDRLNAKLYDGPNSTPLAGVGDQISGVAPSMTLTDAAGLFTANDIGRELVLNNWSNPLNDGIFIITAVGGGGTTADYQNGIGVPEVFAGAWSIIGPVAPTTGVGDTISGTAPNMTLTDAAALFTANDVGRVLQITGAPTVGNNGLFIVTAVGGGGTTVDYQNALGAAEAVPAAAWSIGESELFVSDVKPFLAGAALGVNEVVIDRALFAGAAEQATVLSIDEATNRLSLNDVLAAGHSPSPGVLVDVGNLLSGVFARGPNSLHLMSPLSAAHAAAQTVDLIRTYHTGTLEDGRIFTANPYRFQGPYVWNPADRLLRSSSGASPASVPVETTLAENIAGPQQLSVAQRAGRTALEVKDASQFVGPPNDYQQALVGRGLGGREQQPIRDIVLQKDMAGLTVASTAVGASQVWQVDDDAGPAYVDQTATFNSAANNDVVIFPAVEAVGDWFAVGFTRRTSKLVMDGLNGVAGVGGVVVWEYWNGAWTALSGVVDGTAGFTTPVADGQEVSWLMPSDWVATVINGSASLFYIRARITTIYAPNPVYDQGFVLPAYEVGDTSLTVSASGLPDAYGYRLFVDDDVSGTAEEIALVRSVSGTAVTLETALTNIHADGDRLFLLADVLKVDQLEFDHNGLIAIDQNQVLVPGLFGEDWMTGSLTYTPSGERVAAVEEVREFIDVTDASLFPAGGGTAILNVGSSVISVQSRISDAKGAVTPGAGPAFALSGTDVTLTDAGAFAATDVGRIIKVRNAQTVGNDGTFIITAVVPGASCTYINASGFTENFGTSPQTTYEVTGMPPAAATVQVEDGSDFPAANFFVVVGKGSRIEEVLEVATNGGGAPATLTFAVGTSGDPVFLHPDGTWVEYVAGSPEVISYESTETGGANERLVFNEELGFYFAGSHDAAEAVNLTTQQAIPSTDGNDYPFYLPSTWADRLEFLFDLARAAGVQVIVSSDR